MSLEFWSSRVEELPSQYCVCSGSQMEVVSILPSMWYLGVVRDIFFSDLLTEGKDMIGIL